jgi:MoaA/NifB/PqqE/SkfB family radical SAM enzyme
MKPEYHKIINSFSLRTRIWNNLPVLVQQIASEGFRDCLNLSFKNWKAMEELPPTALNLNISELCNAKCRFCISRMIKERKHTMDMELYLSALEQYRQMGGKMIELNPLIGEPLMDPQIFRRIDSKVLSGFEKVMMFTNGLLLNKNGNIERLLDSGITELHISLAAFDRELYSREMGVDKYDDVKDGIIKLLRKNEDLGKPKKVYIEIKGRISNLLTEDFVSEILPLIDSQFLRMNISVSKLFDDWIGAISLDDLGKGCGFSPKGILRLRPCCRTFSLTVMTNGLVRACGCRFGINGKNDALIVGDLNKETLEKIWKSDAIKYIRRSFGHPKQLEVCSKCRLYRPI